MPGSGFPTIGAQGPVPQQDPLDALAQLLGVHPSTLSNPASFGADNAGYSEGVDALRGGDPQAQPVQSTSTSPSAGAAPAASSSSPYAAAPSGPVRNQALSAALAKKYGIPEMGNGSAPQTDLEALDSFMRQGDIAEKVAPIEAQGENTARVAQINNEGTKEAIKGQYDLQGKQMQAQAAITAAMLKANGSQTDPGMVDYWAKQAMGDTSVLAKIPTAMRGAVETKMSQMGGTPQTLSNQTRQMSEAANDLLPMIDQIQTRAQALKDHGAFDLVNSPVRQFLVKHGMGSMLGYTGDPSIADEAGRFQTDLGLLQSGVARAHAGARGAGNSDMAARFEKLMNAGGDLPTFLGNLQGVRDLLSIYAQHTNPQAGGGPSATADPYSNPDYTPR